MLPIICSAVYDICNINDTALPVVMNNIEEKKNEKKIPALFTIYSVIYEVAGSK